MKQARIKKRKSLVQVAIETKIPQATLKAIEADDFRRLPATTFVKGFIRNFAFAVGVDPEKVLAIFRRDFTTTESGEILPCGLSKPLNDSGVWSKRLVVMATIVVILSSFFVYIGWQLKSYLAPPRLTITQPKVDTVLKGPRIEVRGRVSADSSVWVNDQLAEILQNGEFRVIIPVLPGKNTLIVKAENRRGKTTEERLTVEVADK